MKRFLCIGLVFSLVATASFAQTPRLPKVTKVTCTTVSIGGSVIRTIALDDTTAGNYKRRNAVPFERRNVMIDFSGTGTGSSMSAWAVDGRLLFSGAVSNFRVVGASSQTDSLKIVYLKANGF